MQPVTGVIQKYPWGDTTFIPKLLGLAADGDPWAELWLGTHPNGQTRLPDGTALTDVVGTLPYLLKVLAAARPLSLQTHPNAQQAIDGFGRGIYPDDRAKPELLYALTTVTALCGVRPPEATIELLEDIGAFELATAVAQAGPGGALEALYRDRLDPSATIAACADSERPEARWVRTLDSMYPGEPSVAATLLLNLVEMEPGQVIRLDAGNLHAYLSGCGVELMGASDNVVRGGLTNKPVDVEELLKTLDTTPLAQPIVDVAADGIYELETAGVALTVVGPGDLHVALDDELAVDLDGGTWWYQAGDEIVVDTTTFIAGRVANQT